MSSYLASVEGGIEDNMVILGPREAMPQLKLKINGYRRSWNRVYIGVTSHPEKRWAQHAINEWRKMVLIYEAYRPSIAITMERELIDYAHRCGFLLEIDNVNPGGEGIGREDRHNYIYLLVGN